MAVKKLVDTWKLKQWFTVVAPRLLNEVQLGEIAGTPESMMNRVVSIPLKDVTRDIAHIYTTIRLRVYELRGKQAYTKFIGHEVAKDYLHTLMRRRRNALSIIFPASSQDGIEFRVKALLFTGAKCSESQKNSLRNAFSKEFLAIAREKEFSELIKEIIFGTLGSKFFEKLKKIVPLRRIEVYKTELKEEFDVPEKKEAEEKQTMAEEGEPAEAQVA